MQKAITIDPSWFKHWFNSSFYHSLYANRDEKEAANFIDTLMNELDPPEGAVMLDLGCGAGRHAKHLASKGFDTTGIDLAYSSIMTAKKEVMSNLRFYQHDMRISFGKNYFDYIFNFFTSFGYFDKDEDNYTVIRNISNALRHGGYVLIDYINAPAASKKLTPSEVKELDGVIYTITRWEDERHFFKKIAIENMNDGKPYNYTEQVAKLSLADFNLMFDRHGLQLKSVFGDYSLNDYDRENSPRLIMLAQKL